MLREISLHFCYSSTLVFYICVQRILNSKPIKNKLQQQKWHWNFIINILYLYQISLFWKTGLHLRKLRYRHDIVFRATHFKILTTPTILFFQYYSIGWKKNRFEGREGLNWKKNIEHIHFSTLGNTNKCLVSRPYLILVRKLIDLNKSIIEIISWSKFQRINSSAKGLVNELLKGKKKINPPTIVSKQKDENVTLICYCLSITYFWNTK